MLTIVSRSGILSQPDRFVVGGATDLFDANWATLWEHVAAAVPDRPVIFHRDDVVTYRDFDDHAGRFAATMSKAGDGRDQKLACFLYNCPDYLEAVYGTLKVDAVPVNVNYRYRGPELAEILNDSNAEVLVFPGSLGRHVLDALAIVEAPPRVLVQVDDDGTPPIAGAVRWQDTLD